MELMLAIVLGDNEKIPAGSSVQAFIQEKTVVLPVDEERTVNQILDYLNTISPSLNGKHLAKLSNGDYAVVVE